MARVIFIISSSKYVLFLLADMTRSKISFRETTLTTCPVSYFPIELIIDLPRSGKKKKKKAFQNGRFNELWFDRCNEFPCTINSPSIRSERIRLVFFVRRIRILLYSYLINGEYVERESTYHRSLVQIVGRILKILSRERTFWNLNRSNQQLKWDTRGRIFYRFAPVYTCPVYYDTPPVSSCIISLCDSNL